MTEPTTDRLPVVDSGENGPVLLDQPKHQPKHRSGFWRELSGALAYGLAVLAVVMIGAQILAAVNSTPGPGIGVVLAHVGAAVVALVAQRGADRSPGRGAALGVFGVLAVTGTALWFLWWA